MINFETLIEALLTASLFLEIISLIRGYAYTNQRKKWMDRIVKDQNAILVAVTNRESDRFKDFLTRRAEHSYNEYRRTNSNIKVTELEFQGALIICAICMISARLFLEVEDMLVIAFLALLIIIYILYNYIFIKKNRNSENDFNKKMKIWEENAQAERIKIDLEVESTFQRKK